MKVISTSDRLCKIMKRAEFARHKKTLSLLPGIFGFIFNNLTISQLSKLAGGTWNTDSMTEGLNYLSSLCQKQECFYNIWSEAEIQKDPSKAEVQLVSLQRTKRSKFVLICPGGAYFSVASLVEGFPVAKKLNELGFSVFILKYRCGRKALAPNPMDDLARALQYIFKHATELNVDTTDYTLMGFSAGGHLAASFGAEEIGYKHYQLPKPSAMVLAYPVITMGEKTHKVSRKNLLGERSKNDWMKQKIWSVENHVTSNYPPTFIWHCEYDNQVSVENSSLLVHSLRKKHVIVHFETFPSTAHGWGTAKGTDAEGWIDRSVEFIRKIKDYKG